MAEQLPWALDAIRALGVAGGPVFAVLWWLERKERVACQTEGRALLIQVLTVANQAATSVTEVTKAVAALGEGTRGANTLLVQLGEFVRSLGPKAG